MFRYETRRSERNTRRMADPRTQLLQRIHADDGLRALWQHVRQGDDGDASHDSAHLLRVALWTLRIGGETIDAREAIGAALLHDLVNVPKDSPDRARASEWSARDAAPLLRDAAFDEAAIERMCAAIRDHSFSRGARPTAPLSQALQDADRLEALGTIGAMRCAATGQRMGARLFHDEDPFAAERPLDDHAYSVDHFFTKLLRLPPTLLTAAGRAEAERRAEVLRVMLRSLASELGVTAPEL